MAQGDSLNRPVNSFMEKGGSLRFLIYFLSGLFLLLQIYLVFMRKIEVRDNSPYLNQEPVQLIGEKQFVNQDFRSPGPLSRIDIMMANYKRVPEGGTLRLSIFKENKRLLLKNYPANTVVDNRFYSFFFDSNKFPAGNYRLQLNYFPVNPKEKLAVWTSKNDLYSHGKLCVNNLPQTGDLTFRVYYKSTFWKEKSRWLFHTPLAKIRGPILTISLLVMILVLNFLFFVFLKQLFTKNKTLNFLGR